MELEPMTPDTLSAHIARLRVLREKAEIPTWKLRVSVCGTCRDDGGEFDIYPVDRGYHGLLRHRGDAEFIVAAANEALPLLSELEKRIEELQSQITNTRMRVEGVDYRIGHFRDNTTPDELREIVLGLALQLEPAEAENRKLREALSKLKNEARSFLSHASVLDHGVTNIRVFELRISEAEAALADKGDE